MYLWLQNTICHRFSFKIATFRVLQFQQPSYLASFIIRYVPAQALRSSLSLSICVPPRKTTMATSKLVLSVASNILNSLPNHLSSVPTLPVLEELSNITYSCLHTLTVVQNLVRSNQLHVSHFVIQRQLLLSHSPEIPLHYITLHYITLHYITLHYITLHYITLHYITLHYITLFHNAAWHLKWPVVTINKVIFVIHRRA